MSYDPIDSDAEIDKALERGKRLAGPPPKREVIISMQTTNTDVYAEQKGYLARADLDDEEEKAAAIAGARAFLNEL